MFAGKTSFKISGMVGIIILLLGITILFGTYQMSKVSKEIINISQEYEPLQNTLDEIRYHQANQVANFEKIKTGQLSGINSDIAKEEFWSSNTIVKSNIAQGKKIAETGYNMAPTDAESSDFRQIHKMFSDMDQTHNEFEEMIKDSMSSAQSDFLLKQISLKQTQLEEEIDGVTNEIKRLDEQSINAIEDHEREWLTVQIGIMLVVGIIAISLRHFMHENNTELKKEIESKNPAATERITQSILSQRILYFQNRLLPILLPKDCSSCDKDIRPVLECTPCGKSSDSTVNFYIKTGSKCSKLSNLGHHVFHEFLGRFTRVIGGLAFDDFNVRIVG